MSPVLIKICGIQSLEIAQTVAKNGADLMGFIFAPSRRYIAPEKAAAISQQIGCIKKVGVFVNEAVDQVNEIAGQCNLDYVQLHGDETPAYCKKINYPIIKAFRYNEEFDCHTVNQYDVDMVLIDSYQVGKAGGTGKTFSWQAAKRSFREIKPPILVAGGLTIGNVKEAVQVLSPMGIDVSGGVEINGEKSVEQIKNFLAYARSLERGNEEC
ncbi:MAG: N-(5-phosphoribosyl)anthranilate isomerase [Massilibacillus sp.]|nr:N-(5-phosphoribosyl)anthranilate isomerase [Massilibacillus sp.]